MEEKFKTKKSIYLSYLLRHNPSAGNLVLDNAGWANVKAVLAALNISYEDLVEIVETDEKGRYEFNQSNTFIRACQGHSINVDLGLEERKPPEILLHGTGWKSVHNILREGIKPMNRQYVHLSTDFYTAFNVGKRHDENIMVFKIMAGEMYRNGYKFYLSHNNIWLTKEVPFKYITFYDQDGLEKVDC